MNYQELEFNNEKLIDGFTKYNEHNKVKITRAQFEQNMHYKIQDKTFRTDISPLLPYNQDWNIDEAYRSVIENIVSIIRSIPSK